jgi:hypothetical protein
MGRDLHLQTDGTWEGPISSLSFAGRRSLGQIRCPWTAGGPATTCLSGPLSLPNYDISLSYPAPPAFGFPDDFGLKMAVRTTC